VELGPIDIGSWALLLAALTFFASAVVFTVAWRSRDHTAARQPPNARADTDTQDATWHQQGHSLLSEARAIVNLTTVGDTLDQPSMSTLSTVTKRIDRLDQRLVRFASLPREKDVPEFSRLSEVIEDLRRVGTSLGSALETERSLRVGSADRPQEERQRSTHRIKQRSAEFDLAANELSWLIETVGDR